MTEDDLPQTSRSHRWLGRGLVVGVAIVAGVLISDLALSLQGPRYAATLTVRPLIVNPACEYMACPSQSSVAGGYQWIISQANLVQSKPVATLVHNAIKGSPNVATLMGNVRVKENNDSDSIDITYTGGNAGQAQRLAVSFANQYALQSTATIRSTLKDPAATAQTTYSDLVSQGLQRTPRGQQVMKQLNLLLATNAAAGKQGGAPGAPIVYAPYPSLVPVTRTTPSAVRATLLGAATGLVIGVAVVLALGSRGPRRPHLPPPRLRRRRAAAAGEA